MISRYRFWTAKRNAIKKWELIALAAWNINLVTRVSCGWCSAMDETYNKVTCEKCPATSICQGEWFTETQNMAIRTAHNAEMVLDMLRNLEYDKYMKGGSL